MKMFLAAITLTIAAPALAQTATVDPHDGHRMAQSAPAADTCTPEHAAMGHCTPETAAAPAADSHAVHDAKGSMPCCEKDANGKMACCEKMMAPGKKVACCEQGSKKAAPVTK